MPTNCSLSAAVAAAAAAAAAAKAAKAEAAPVVTAATAAAEAAFVVMLYENMRRYATPGKSPNAPLVVTSSWEC